LTHCRYASWREARRDLTINPGGAGDLAVAARLLRAEWGMGYTYGLAAIAAAVTLTFILSPKDGVERAFARNWLALIGVTMGIMVLFIVGVILIIG
jgi:hypothetical protein